MYMKQPNCAEKMRTAPVFANKQWCSTRLAPQHAHQNGMQGNIDQSLCVNIPYNVHASFCAGNRQHKKISRVDATKTEVHALRRRPPSYAKKSGGDVITMM
ncbi:unnamed protein product [Ectocarpus sp. 12 AP-2014]